MHKKTTKIIIFSALNALVILLANVFWFNMEYFELIVFIAFLITIMPAGAVNFHRSSIIKKRETYFPKLLGDLSHSLETEMTITQAVELMSKGDFNELDPQIERLRYRLTEMSMPFNQALKIFGEETESAEINQSIKAIIGAYNDGGNLKKVFASISESSRQLNALKLKRESRAYTHILVAYVIFFIFLSIVIGLTVTFAALTEKDMAHKFETYVGDLISEEFSMLLSESGQTMTLFKGMGTEKRITGIINDSLAPGDLMPKGYNEDDFLFVFVSPDEEINISDKIEYGGTDYEISDMVDASKDSDGEMVYLKYALKKTEEEIKKTV
ncbi:MAG: type II secretion system F family protein, partial [Candidatus Diapherotrites archaeon]|nr:type II secretion system F family protein [Candidatus Diapherotrites archaeon]